MLSLSIAVNTLNLKTLNPIAPTPSKSKILWRSSSSSRLEPISATLTPSPSSSTPSNFQQQLYQPFRPPPSPLPSQLGSLDVTARLEILAQRLGRWYELAPLITSLVREGFTPPTIEEATGITGVEQNRFVVAAQVRESLVQSNADPQVVYEFESGGAEILYEIRLLSARQRTAAARYIIENRFDGKGAQDLARAIKDFPRRRGDKAWDNFDYNLPGDCLSFMYYRQGREHKNPSEQRTSALEQALSVAETEKAKSAILEELQEKDGGEENKFDGVELGVRVPVVRLRIGEVAEATSVLVLPVCRSEKRDREILEAPIECSREGEFGVVVAEKGWERWVVLPGWESIVDLGKGGVVISFADARVLPWRVNKWYKEEPILVVADRTRKEVAADDGFYLVAAADDGGDLKVERGSDLKKTGVSECLATVLLVVRPPKYETDDQLSDEDWD
ncbi:hypothetical protein L6164_035209 [Bauhinia variegata]|uniref:Uncharacterized protein n=1 Tax=Bauhinia variegata TaxID=167791 RepID=A0ACB9KWX9_BAUVA|nr:hypothetical protein L6164_035209 [Bauhinia variegata]